MLTRAKELRKLMTSEERRLWYTFLRHYPEKIYKQKVVGPFIADFYCPRAKLAIEIDGSQHYSEEGEEYDIRRLKYFEKMGIQILRFSNYEINRYFPAVCDKIDGVIQERKEPLSVTCGDTTPQRGEARN